MKESPWKVLENVWACDVNAGALQRKEVIEIPGEGGGEKRQA